MFAGLSGVAALVYVYLFSLALLLAGIWIGRRLGAWRRGRLSEREA